MTEHTRYPSDSPQIINFISRIWGTTCHIECLQQRFAERVKNNEIIILLFSFFTVRDIVDHITV